MTTETGHDGVITQSCPATGRSASACTDQTHVDCWAGHRASVELDRQVAQVLR